MKVATTRDKMLWTVDLIRTQNTSYHHIVPPSPPHKVGATDRGLVSNSMA